MRVVTADVPSAPASSTALIKTSNFSSADAVLLAGAIVVNVAPCGNV